MVFLKLGTRTLRSMCAIALAVLLASELVSAAESRAGQAGTQVNAGVISRRFFVGLAPTEDLLLPGIREQIVHELFTEHRPRWRTPLRSSVT